MNESDEKTKLTENMLKVGAISMRGVDCRLKIVKELAETIQILQHCDQWIGREHMDLQNISDFYSFIEELYRQCSRYEACLQYLCTETFYDNQQSGIHNAPEHINQNETYDDRNQIYLPRS